MKYTSQYWIVMVPFMRRLMVKKHGKNGAKGYIKIAKQI